MVFRNYASGAWEDSLKLIANGAAELYYDNAKCLETRSDGVSITNSGSETFRFTGNIFSGIGDSAKIYMGAGDDLKIYHDGSSAFIENATGVISSWSAGNHEFKTNNGHTKALFKNGNACELYYNNTKRFETDPDGVQVTGTIQAHKNIGDSDYTSHSWHVLQQDTNDLATAIFEHSGDSTPYGVIVAFTDASPDGNTRYFLDCVDSTTRRMVVYSDGDLWNHDNNYTGSDRTLKENIVDATPKLEDLKKLKVRNFNWKSDYFPEKSKKKQLGFIAQEVEEVFPSLVSEHDIAPNSLKEGHVPVMKKAIKQAWDPIIIKAMQELIAKVETLETKVAALEAK